MPSLVPFALYFFDEKIAYAFVEELLWRGRRVCPHCGSVDRSGKLGSKSTRPGLFKCYNCREPFTVKLGTLFESSNVKLHLWLRAMYLLCSSKNRVNSTRLCECLGVTAKTAWSLRHCTIAALSKGRQTVLRNAGLQRIFNPMQRAWSAAWNLAVKSHRLSFLPPTLMSDRDVKWGARMIGGCLCHRIGGFRPCWSGIRAKVYFFQKPPKLLDDRPELSSASGENQTAGTRCRIPLDQRRSSVNKGFRACGFQLSRE